MAAKYTHTMTGMKTPFDVNHGTRAGHGWQGTYYHFYPHEGEDTMEIERAVGLRYAIVTGRAARDLRKRCESGETPTKFDFDIVDAHQHLVDRAANNLSYYKNWKSTRLREALAACASAGLEYIEVQFDGSGDSGQIEFMGAKHKDKPYADPASLEAVKFQAAPIPDLRDLALKDYPPRLMLSEETAEDVEVTKLFEAFVYELLEDTDIDWYNNDGGFGEVTIDVETGTVTSEVNVRIINSECHPFEGTVDAPLDQEAYNEQIAASTPSEVA